MKTFSQKFWSFVFKFTLISLALFALVLFLISRPGVIKGEAYGLIFIPVVFGFLLVLDLLFIYIGISISANTWFNEHNVGLRKWFYILILGPLCYFFIMGYLFFFIIDNFPSVF